MYRHTANNVAQTMFCSYHFTTQYRDIKPGVYNSMNDLTHGYKVYPIFSHRISLSIHKCFYRHKEFGISTLAAYIYLRNVDIYKRYYAVSPFKP